MIFLRVEPGLYNAIERAARARQQNISDFVRQVMLAELARAGLLSDLEKRALSVGAVGADKPSAA